MAAARSTTARDISASPFPLTPNWEFPTATWHEHYPDGVPPGLDYESLRVEQLLLRAQQCFPWRMAIRYFHANWTYTELVERVQLAAANCVRLGINSGDRVMLVLPNCPEYVVAWFALQWLGVEVVPVNPLYSATELAQLAEKSDAQAVIALDMRLPAAVELTRRCHIPLLIVTTLSSHLPAYMRWPYRLKLALRGRIRAASGTRMESFTELYQSHVTPIAEPLHTNPDCPAVLQPTGGTTGSPKIAVLTHKNLQANVAQLHAWSGVEPGTEVFLSVLPFFHVFGSTVAMLSPIAGGATLLLQARFRPSWIFKVIERHRPGIVPLVPFMFHALNKEMRCRGKNLEDIRLCMSGASPLRAEICEEFQQRTGAVLFEGYGLSEASPVTHVNPPNDRAQIGSIGLPLPDTQVRVVDSETGQIDLPQGEVGELVIRGPQVMSGYLDDPEETENMLRDGWLFTGDLCRMEENGFFTIVDRKKDMVISGGLNVYPTEVEEVLATHPSVRECAVVGVPDDKYGQRVVAYVVPTTGSTVDTDLLKKHCRQDLASYKVPRKMIPCDELPITFLGKLQRNELRSRAA